MTFMKFDANSAILLVQNDEATLFSGLAVKNVGTGTLVASKVYYLTTGGAWALADANNTEDAASHLLGFAFNAGAVGTVGIGLQGFVLIESSEFTIGAPLYLSNTAGSLTTTVPSSGWARIVGYAVTENAIYFDPDKSYVEIA